MKRIKILHIIGSMDRGGSETYLMNLIRGLDDDTFSFIFLCFGNKKYDYEEEVYRLGHKIIKIEPLKKNNLINFLRNLFFTMGSGHYDIIETHIYPSAFIYLIFAKILGINVRIAHSHTASKDHVSSVLRRIYLFIAKKLAIRFSTIRLACGQEAGRKYFIKETNYTIINNFIPVKEFEYNTKLRSHYRNKLRVSKNTILIGNVARFESVKNHKFMLNILKSMIDSGVNAKLLLIGDGPLLKSIKDMGLALEISDKIIFYGKSDKVNQLYNAMDYFILPSLWEGFPMCLIEAQANGLECVVSNNVDSKCNITGLVTRLDIEEGVNRWSQKLRSKRAYFPSNHKALADYDDIKCITKIINIYSESYENAQRS